MVGVSFPQFPPERERDILRDREKKRERERAREIEKGRNRDTERARARESLALKGRDKHVGTSLIRNWPPLGPCGKPLPRALWWPSGGWRFLMSEVPL